MLTRRTAILSASAGLAVACTDGPAPVSQKSDYNTTLKPLPFAVQEIYPAAHKGRIHIAGGLLAEGGRAVAASSHHIAYDPKTQITSSLASLPAPRHHPHIVDHKGRLYLFGGFGANPGAINWIMSADTLVYDDSANTWSALASAPTPHAETVAASIGERIHIVGGRRPKGAANLAYGDHADSLSHLVYEPAANAWATAAPALLARNSATGALIDSLWHVVGGRSMSGGPSDAHEVYDPQEDRWRDGAPMPKGSGAGGNACGVLAGQIYVFGGEYFDNGGRVHPEVWRYNPKSDAWTSAPPMPTPRHGLGAVVLDNAIWLVGGATKPSGVDTSAVVESFTVSV